MGACDASVVLAAGTSWSRRKGAMCSLTCPLSLLPGLGLSTYPPGFLQWGTFCKNGSFLRQAWVQRVILSSRRAALWLLSSYGRGVDMLWAFCWLVREVWVMLIQSLDCLALPIPEMENCSSDVGAVLWTKSPLLEFVEHFEVLWACKLLLIFRHLLHLCHLALVVWVIPVIGHS